MHTRGRTGTAKNPEARVEKIEMNGSDQSGDQPFHSDHSGRTRHSTAAAATLNTTTPTAVDMLIVF
jgi:hypothetical protein